MTRSQSLPPEVNAGFAPSRLEYLTHFINRAFSDMSNAEQVWLHRRLCNHLEAIAHVLWDDASEPGETT